MPYRRLPNTDLARLRALRIAYEKSRELHPFELAFSQSTAQRINSNLHLFESSVQESRHAFNVQVEKSREYGRLLKKIKLYISHFIQVTNMAISRGDLTSSDRDYFGFGRDKARVPLLSSENEVIEWGEKLITGEAARLKKGLNPITNPSIAILKVRYETFLDAYQYQKILQKNLQRSQNKLIELRKIIDLIITSVWNEVEEHYKDLPEESKRNSAKIYGVVFFYRKNELPPNTV